MDIDYNELFGIGEEEQEAAAPAAEEQHEEQPTETQPEEAPAEDAGAEKSGDAGTAETSTQSPEDNARFAAARRKAEAERDAAIEKAKADAKAEADRAVVDVLKAMGLKDPYSGEPIDTKEKFDEYTKHHAEERRAQLLRRSGMSEAEFGDFVEGLPEVRAAREAKRQAEEAEEQARQMQAKAKVDEQLKEIEKLDPTVKSLKDLAGHPSYEAVYEKVKQGYTLPDAFRLANWDALQRTAQQAAQQAARNAGSKAHMVSHSSRGAGTVTVPPDVMAEYRQLNPGMTDAEITAHYNKYLKK